MSYMVTIQDVDGLPRAWGHASTEKRARQEAERQWAKRLRERKAEGTTDRSEQRGETIVKEMKASGSVPTGTYDKEKPVKRSRPKKAPKLLMDRFKL